MGELYNPYPKLPKNIRQIGERDQNVRLYVEDYVHTYLKRLYPAGGRDLRVGLLLGEVRSQDGTPYLFVDGALEMEDVVRSGEQVEFTEEAWRRAYQAMDQMFPRRTVLGWFLCGLPDRTLSPLNYWKQHGQYFSAKNQLMYLSCGLEGEEAVYVAAEDGFYKVRGYCVYYERNQMMQDYMVSRREARRVEPGIRDSVIRDFRQKMEDNREEARKRRSALGGLKAACGVLSVAVLACGVVMFNNYQKMRQMEAVIASALPEGTARKWSELLNGEEKKEDREEILFEEIPGEVFPTAAEIVIEPEEERQGEPGSVLSGENGAGEESGSDAVVSGGGGNGAGAGTEAGARAGDGSGSVVSGGGGSGTGTGAEAGTVAKGGPDSVVSGGKGSGAGTGTGAGAGAENSVGSVVSGGTGAGTGTGVGAVTGVEGGSGSGPDASRQEVSESRTPQDGADDSPSDDAEPVQVPQDAVLYTVQQGETLYGICLSRYHSVNDLEMICRWNQLGSGDDLAVGQELYLPPVD